MDPISIAAAALPIVGGIAGNAFASEDEERARKNRDRGLLEILGLDAEELALHPEAIRSAMSDISEDPSLRSAQMSALRQMQGVSEAGGMDPQSMATLNAGLGAAGAYERGQREALANSFAAKGMGGSGQQMAQAMLGQQMGAQRANQTGLDAASEARQRALQAMMNTNQMAGGVRGADWQRASQKAGALDSIARFNAQNTNEANRFNTGLTQDLARMKSGAYGTAAGFDEQEADRKRKMLSGMGQGGAQALSGFGGGK